jgi:hypothetical protein
MQNVINRSLAPNTAAHYALKQPGVTIVRVKGNGRQQVSLTQIEHRFKNLGDAFGVSSNDVYFQLKSFKCANGFHNVKGTDRIALYVDFLSLEEFHRENDPNIGWGSGNGNDIQWSVYTGSNELSFVPFYLSLSPTGRVADSKSYFMTP